MMEYVHTATRHRRTTRGEKWKNKVLQQYGGVEEQCRAEIIRLQHGRLEAKINIANKEHVNNMYGDINSDGHKL